jgi:hypothetical protein
MSENGGSRPGGEIVVFEAADGSSRIRVLLEGETVWLTQRLMSELYEIGVNTINHHVKTIYEDGELSPEATIRKYRIVQIEGERQIERLVDHYNLDMILAIGHRRPGQGHREDAAGGDRATRFGGRRRRIENKKRQR